MRRLLLVVVAFLPTWTSAIPVSGSQMMVAVPSRYAVDTAEAIIKKGGNVVDVAVAMGFTLAVTSPYFASLGGGGFAVVHHNNKTQAIDFRETAPSKASSNLFANSKDSEIGGKAVATPGIVAGYYEMHRLLGKLPWKVLLEDSIRLAEKGFKVSGEWVDFYDIADAKLDASARKYLNAGDRKLKPGDYLKQPQLARALRQIQKDKARGFYHGPVAEDLVSSVASSGGVLSLEDLKSYQVRFRDPLVQDFLGYKLYLMPPPSSGGVLVKTALSLAEELNLKDLKPLSVDELHLWGEILSRAFSDRNRLGDPDFGKNPLDEIFSKDHLKTLAASIDLRKAKTFKPAPISSKESLETTHLSILDKNGNAVSMTITLNGVHGSGVFSRKFGIALNNEMDDFMTAAGRANQFGLVQGDANKIEPNKRPLSSMTPTLVEKDGKIVLAIGAPGGPRIISAVIQAMYRILANGYDVDLAIQIPRVHHQNVPNTLYLDPKRFSPEIVEGLKARGHVVEDKSTLARVYAVHWNDHKKVLEAAFDSRGEGAAGGF